MKKTMIMAVAALMTASAMASCGQTGTYSSETVVVSDYPAPLNYREVKKGDKVERDMKVGKFASVELTGSVTVIYVQDKQCRVVLTGESKDLDCYTAEVKNGTLRVKYTNKRKGLFGSTPEVKAYLYAPSLEGIVLAGAGDLKMPQKVAQDGDMDIMLSGAGNIKAKDLKVRSLSVTVSGAGNVDIDHLTASKDVHLTVSGAGDMEADIEARDVYSLVSGSGDMDLTVDCRVLESTVSGTGDMELKGKCQHARTVSSGWSRMDTKHLKVTGK